MLYFAGIRKKMSSAELSIIFFALLASSVSLGRRSDISLSVCWMSRDGAMERQHGNLWLNRTALKSLTNDGKLTSLTLSPTVENRLTVHYGGSVYTWTFTVSPSNYIKIRGQQKPLRDPTANTQAMLDLLGPAEVFACENSTLFFHQEDDFFLAYGYSRRLPVRLESRSPSTLLVSWTESQPADGGGHSVALYHSDGGSYDILSTDTASAGRYDFTALDSCSPYAACVQIAGTNSFTCISTITDPDVPKNFKVSSWNSSSISLAWDCPEKCKYSLFLLTSFYLDGADRVTEEVPLWHASDHLAITLSGLQPCTRVRFGLQTVCQAGMETRYSEMVINDGNSAHSSIEALRQTSHGPDNYTLSWEVRNTSSVSMFRVYHEGALQGTTLLTSYTARQLLPCQEYQARVEAVCGESVLMSARTLTAHTGPRGVSGLSHRFNESTAFWTPGTANRPSLTFAFSLALENGPTLKTGRLTETELHLPGLEEGNSYVLNVWEECGGHWKSERSELRFTIHNAHLIRAMGSNQNPGTFDISSLTLTVVLPWPLPQNLQGGVSEPSAKMGKIVRDKLQELLSAFYPPVRLELAAVEPTNETDKTQIRMISFDASNSEVDIPLLAQEQLLHIKSLNTTDFVVRDEVIHWEGPDLCTRSVQASCPRNSLCINTLSSHACECQHGYYDVRLLVRRPVSSQPLCNEKGIFSQCLDKVMTGGVAKPYLMSYIGGSVDVKLNDGRCAVEESDIFYLFRSSRRTSECGTEKRVNKTHIEFQNTFTVSLTQEETISRRDLKVVWKCVYPLYYVRNAHVRLDLEWLTSLSFVEFNSSLKLVLTMNLYSDLSYSYSYADAISLELADTLFFQVALQTNNSFASDVLLQVESCWATESADPEDTVQAVFLQDGCPADNTFHWLTVNGLAQESRFSVQMFKMPQGLPLYFHCLANICGHKEVCTKNCSSPQRTKRAQRDSGGRHAAIVSAGPLVVIGEPARVKPSPWKDHMTMILIVAGSIGILGVTVLSVSATKAIMTYYERLQEQ